MKPNGRRAWRQAGQRFRRKQRKLGCNPSHTVGVYTKRHWTHAPGHNGLCGGQFPPKATARPFTARSLVGMSEGAKKRLRERIFCGDQLPPFALGADSITKGLRIGERLRPCPGCANCDPYMASYGSFYGGDPRNFTPDEECSTEAERERHRQHCEAWEKGERPTVKVSGIEWTEAMTSTGRDGKPKTFPAGYKFVERTAYGLGVTRATNDQEGRFCDGSGVLPARKKP